MSDEQSTSATQVLVWDPLVRILHWVLVIAFFIAFFTEDDTLAFHVWAGYVIGVGIVLRVLWGFVGTRHARFSDFLFGPFRAWTYLFGLLRFRAGERYLGHSPAGAIMVYALLIVLAGAVWTGLEHYAERGHGPLAQIGATAALVQPAAAAEDEGENHEAIEQRFRGHRSAWRQAHELFANLGMLLVILHIGGVLLASVVHRENLIGAMFTGRKPPL